MYIRVFSLATMLFVLQVTDGHAQNPEMEGLIEAFEHSERLVNSMQCTMEVEYLPPASSAESSANDNLAEPNITIEVMSRTVRVDWAQRDSQIRSTIFGFQDEIWRVEDDQLFDGESVVLHNAHNGAATIDTDPSKIVYDFRKSFGLRDLNGRPWSEMLRLPGTTVERISEEGESYYIATIRDEEYLKTDKIWIDPAKGYRVIKEEFYNLAGELKRILEYSEFERFANGIWIPRKGTQRLLHADEEGDFSYGGRKWRLGRMTENRLLSLAVNEPIPNETFQLQLPGDTRVKDNRLKMAYEPGQLTNTSTINDLLKDVASDVTAAEQKDEPDTDEHIDGTAVSAAATEATSDVADSSGWAWRGWILLALVVVSVCLLVLGIRISRNRR
jgi:hypothetical protein